MDERENLPLNPCAETRTTLEELVSLRLSRRGLIRSAIATAGLAGLGGMQALAAQALPPFRFTEIDPHAGAFMTGFFPVMMFGLPAACLAMYHSALPARRKAVGGLLFSMGLTSFLTGITEPIEFTFMFVAPVLFVVHAVLTGLSMALMDWLQVRHGFGFSAGLFDYVLNFNLASKPLWILLVGAGWFMLYYGIFRWVIDQCGHCSQSPG